MNMKQQLWRATNDLPQCFSQMLNALDAFNVKGEIHYEADESDDLNDEEEEDGNDDGNDDNEPDPELIREVQFTMKKMSNGTLMIEMNYSNRSDSISLSSTISRDHEIVKLDSSGIQPSTIDPEWD